MGARPSNWKEQDSLRGEVRRQLLSGCRDPPTPTPGSRARVGGWGGFPGEEASVRPQGKAGLGEEERDYRVGKPQGSKARPRAVFPELSDAGKRWDVSKVKMWEVAAKCSHCGPRRKMIGCQTCLASREFILHMFPRPSWGQQCSRH